MAATQSNPPISFRGRLVRLSNKLLRPLGAQIIAAPKYSGPGSKPVPVTIGRFTILVPKSNPLSRIYRVTPDYSSEVGRIAAAVHVKYPAAAAIDVGANVGDTLAVIKSAVELPVLCVEGDPSCGDLLTANAKQFKDVRIERCFLGDVEKEIEVEMSKVGWNTTIVPLDGAKTAKASRRLQLRTLDGVLDQLNDGRTYKFLKVDAEGYDGRIIRGGAKWIGREHPVILMEYNRHNMDEIGEDGVKFLSFLRDLGYDRVLFYDAFGRFMFPGSVRDQSLLHDMHEYIEPNQSAIPYYDLCLVHESDADLAEAIISGERKSRSPGHA